MLDDFKIITHRLPKTSRIIGLADLHIGSPQFKPKHWYEMKKYILENDDAYIFIDGDLMDNDLKSSVGSCYEATMQPPEQIEWLVRELTPLKDRILCFTPR